MTQHQLLSDRGVGERNEVDSYQGMLEAAQALTASFQKLRDALLARTGALDAMSQAVGEAREAVAHREKELQSSAGHVSVARDHLCAVLSDWLHAGNEGRALSAAELHRECAELAAQRGLGAECLGDSKSFGLRLAKQARHLSARLKLERHVGPGRHAMWSVRPAH